VARSFEEINWAGGRSARWAALRVVLPYTVLALVWILLSDRALNWLVDDMNRWVWLSIAKGSLFVLVTSGLLYFLVLRLLDRINRLIMREMRLRERRNMEIQANEQRLKFALETSGVGSLEIDLETMTTFRTPLHDHLFGYDQPLESWTPQIFFEHVIPADRQRLREVFETATREGQAWNLEFRIRRKDGQRRWLWAAGRSVSEAGDDRRRVMVIVQDITERREAQEQVKRLNASLERRVAERTAELTAANQELDSFAYAVSHDLRAPLRAMNGFSEALVEDCADQLDETGRGYLEQIALASGRMGELIEGLLVLSRCTRGQIERADVDLSALAERLLGEYQTEEPDRQVSLEIQPGLRANGDPRMIEVLMRNLLENAWKYTGRTEGGVIRVRAGEIDGQPAIEIEDNGVGFDPAHAERLFKAFNRLHRQDEFPGTGIGLATVERIVHRHGGKIVATGKAGAGARFAFTVTGCRGAETRTGKAE